MGVAVSFGYSEVYSSQRRVFGDKRVLLVEFNNGAALQDCHTIGVWHVAADLQAAR